MIRIIKQFSLRFRVRTFAVSIQVKLISKKSPLTILLCICSFSDHPFDTKSGEISQPQSKESNICRHWLLDFILCGGSMVTRLHVYQRISQTTSKHPFEQYHCQWRIFTLQYGSGGLCSYRNDIVLHSRNRWCVPWKDVARHQ